MKSTSRILLLLFLPVLFATTVSADEAPDSEMPAETTTEAVAVFETSLGTMAFRFFPQKAPKTVAQIKSLIEDGWYDGKEFYRVVEGHVIQAGDVDGGAAPTVPGEFGAYPHVPGAVGLARDEDPDSGTTEIYVCHAARPHLDGSYAVFGLLVEGFDVLNRIATTEVEEKWLHETVAFHEPVEPVVIEKAWLEERMLPPVPKPSEE